MGIFETLKAKEEMIFFLRNSDILTISQRGVTTSQDTGSFISATTHLINNTQIKNIRDITIATVLKEFGTDYTYDTNFDDSGTIKTKITFTSAQTGDYTINYDTGTDSIFPDWPKDSLSISSYPRISIDIISEDSDPLGFGNQQIAVQTSALFSITAHSNKTRTVDEVLDDINTAILANQNDYFYFKITLKGSKGPMLVKEGTKNEIFHKNIDFISSNNIERP